MPETKNETEVSHCETGFNLPRFPRDQSVFNLITVLCFTEQKKDQKIKWDNKLMHCKLFTLECLCVCAPAFVNGCCGQKYCWRKE